MACEKPVISLCCFLKIVIKKDASLVDVDQETSLADVRQLVSYSQTVSFMYGVTSPTWKGERGPIVPNFPEGAEHLHCEESGFSDSNVH